MGKKLLPLLLALLLLLAACGGTPEPQNSALPSASAAPSAEPSAEPTSTPYDGPLNPLTGLPIGEEWVNRRPVAIMLNNLKQALPQLGQSQADIIYEIPAEGGQLYARYDLVGEGKTAPSVFTGTGGSARVSVYGPTRLVEAAG